MCKCECVNYLSSIVLDAKLVVIHSGLDIVRVCLRRKDTDLHAAVHVCITNPICYSPSKTWLDWEDASCVLCNSSAKITFLIGVTSMKMLYHV